MAISAIAGDLGTTVSGVQTAITLFTLTMAALMIPPIYILVTRSRGLTASPSRGRTSPSAARW